MSVWTDLTGCSTKVRSKHRCSMVDGSVNNSHQSTGTGGTFCMFLTQWHRPAQVHWRRITSEPCFMCAILPSEASFKPRTGSRCSLRCIRIKYHIISLHAQLLCQSAELVRSGPSGCRAGADYSAQRGDVWRRLQLDYFVCWSFWLCVLWLRFKFVVQL